jgi:hypothetical protein
MLWTIFETLLLPPSAGVSVNAWRERWSKCSDVSGFRHA